MQVKKTNKQFLDFFNNIFEFTFVSIFADMTIRSSNCQILYKHADFFPFSYTVGMACPYHDKIDKSRFCSMNCVKRWAFLIMDKMCPPLGIGNHTKIIH